MMLVDLQSIMLLRITFESPTKNLLKMLMISMSTYTYTDAIKIIHLQDVEIEQFRKANNIDWLTSPKYPGIQKTHLWLKETCNNKTHCCTAKTADQLLTKVKTIQNKNKSSHKNKKYKKMKMKKWKKAIVCKYECIYVYYLHMYKHPFILIIIDYHRNKWKFYWILFFFLILWAKLLYTTHAIW